MLATTARVDRFARSGANSGLDTWDMGKSNVGSDRGHLWSEPSVGRSYRRCTEGGFLIGVM